MNAKALKRDLLQPEWVENFAVICFVGDTWYHFHDDEEVEDGSHIAFKAKFGLPIATLRR